MGRQLSCTPDQSEPSCHHDVYTRPSLPVTNRSSWSVARASAVTTPSTGKNPPMGRQLLLMPDQSEPSCHHDVYTRPSLPPTHRAKGFDMRATACTVPPTGKNPPMGRQLLLMPD